MDSSRSNRFYISVTSLYYSITTTIITREEPLNNNKKKIRCNDFLAGVEVVCIEMANTELESILEVVKSTVDDLIYYRDHFFENHDISLASQKPQYVKERLRQTLETLDNLTKNVEGDSRFKLHCLYQRGKALNVESEYSEESERLLSKVVKLDPALVEAWNELGECYWKRGDLCNAKNCFEGALNHCENKVSLRNLSIVFRQTKSSSAEERLKNIENGLTRARKAVSLDTRDGISWTVLGNAYLAHFFSVSQNPRTLKQAMSAYKQAEREVVAKSSAELHYNKAIALKYEEDFTSALESFSRAIALDPTWESPVMQKKSLLRSLTEIQMLVEAKGKLKTKRFNHLIDSINPNTQLGPYKGGCFISPRNGKTIPLKEIPFKDLKEGSNLECVVLGMVICSVVCEDSVPFTFCLVDRTGQIVAVNLYNLAPGKGVIIGDSVAIAEPYFTKIVAEHENQRISFDLLRVESPLILVINGKKASQDLQAGIELSTFTKSN